MSALRYRLLDAALARGLAPDPLLRAGSRWGAVARERRESRGGVAAQDRRLRELVARMSTGPVAEAPARANAQHYELPADFLGLILGPRRKYSCGLWSDGVATLADAELAMLALTAERAGLHDGQRILDLGCGWGSLSLWLAERYPDAQVVGVSNAARQRAHIELQATARGLTNLEVVTADVNDFAAAGTFDRVVAIELFEHLRNWHELLRRIAGWLRPHGRAFVHHFSHRTLPYRFESGWATERFFTAGLMPSHDLLLHFQDDLRVAGRWAIPGTHYARTLRAWLANLDACRDEALAILRADGRTRAEARRLLGAWRLFLLSTATVWSQAGGDRWLVSHSLLERR